MDQSAPIAVFEARGLTKTYRTGEVEVQALRGLDLDLYRGEFAVFLGPSGSGKSTLFNILGGLDRATSGSARFEGLELTRLSDRALTAYRRKSVGFVFQFYNLVPSLTARENVALVTEIAARPPPCFSLSAARAPPECPYQAKANTRAAAAPSITILGLLSLILFM